MMRQRVGRSLGVAGERLSLRGEEEAAGGEVAEVDVEEGGEARWTMGKICEAKKRGRVSCGRGGRTESKRKLEAAHLRPNFRLQSRRPHLEAHRVVQPTTLGRGVKVKVELQTLGEVQPVLQKQLARALLLVSHAAGELMEHCERESDSQRRRRALRSAHLTH